MRLRSNGCMAWYYFQTCSPYAEISLFSRASVRNSWEILLESLSGRESSSFSSSSSSSSSSTRLEQWVPCWALFAGNFRWRWGARGGDRARGNKKRMSLHTCGNAYNYHLTFFNSDVTKNRWGLLYTWVLSTPLREVNFPFIFVTAKQLIMVMSKTLSTLWCNSDKWKYGRMKDLGSELTRWYLLEQSTYIPACFADGKKVTDGRPASHATIF